MKRLFYKIDLMLDIAFVAYVLFIVVTAILL